jgi:hypothetical protein
MTHDESCWSCKSPLDGAGRYCHHCGNGQGRFLQWYYQPMWIAVLTVTVLGPLSLLLVWRTPRLGRPSKWIGTLLIVGVTVYLGHQLWQTLQTLRSLLMSVS